MRHFLAGVEITPKNYDKIGLVLNYGDESEVLSVTTDTVTLSGEAFEMAYKHAFINKLAYEMMPYQMVTESTPPQTLDYALSLRGAVYRPDLGEGDFKLVKRGSNETFMKRANGLSFTSLAKQGVVFPTVNVPYIIVRDAQVMEGITLALTVFSMEQALAQAIKDTLDLVAEFISAIGLDVSDAIAAGLKLTEQLIYTAALIVAVIKLGQKLRELLFPKVRYLKACRIKDLIKIGIEQMSEAGINCGYTLSSTLLDSISNEYILPVPLVKNKKNFLDFLENELNQSFNYGYPTAQDSTPTLGSLITAVEDMNNARTTTVNKVVRIERRDYLFNQFAGLNPALVLQGDRSDQLQLNDNEMFRRAYYHYMVDSTDFHTMNEFDQTDCEDSTEPVIVNYPDLIDIDGLKDIPIPFALGSRKKKLNRIESIAYTAFQIIDSVASVFGGNTSLASNIENKIGALQIGQQIFEKTKLLYLVNGKQPANYLNFIGARAKYNKNYLIDFIDNNDYIVRELASCVIDSNDFVTLQQSNYAEIDGKTCELTRVEFFDQMSKADVTYKEPFDWASNLKRVQIDD